MTAAILRGGGGWRNPAGLAQPGGAGATRRGWRNPAGAGTLAGITARERRQ